MVKESRVKVSAVACGDYNSEKVYCAVKQAIEESGFVFQKGKTVLIKPNLLTAKTPGAAVTTHPSVIEALCRVLEEQKCSIIIGESSGNPFGKHTQKAFTLSGIRAVAEKYHARIVCFEETKKKELPVPSGVVLAKIPVSTVLDEADYIINVPKLKNHTLMRYTGAVKNLLGIIPGGTKQHYHARAPDQESFAHLLLDIYQSVRPALTVMDAVIGMEGNGPSAGRPKKVGYILASTDAVALDIVAQNIVGYSYTAIPTTRLAVERGLFKSPNSITLVGRPKRVPFKKAITFSAFSRFTGGIVGFVFKLMVMDPVISTERCRRCGVCVTVCPQKTIKEQRTKEKTVNEKAVKERVNKEKGRNCPVIDLSDCIHCYTCHELCPFHAIDLRGNLFMRIYHFVIKTLSRE